MSPSRRAAFLDRDGTVIAERDYLSDPEGVELLPGAAEAITRFRAAGWAVVIITNQSGIARGLFSEDDYRAVTARLEAELARNGTAVDAVLHCPHHPDFTGPCDCRKPATGMLHKAARLFDLELGGCVVVGDKRSDLGAAASVGALPVLVRTGYGRTTEAEGELPVGTLRVDGLLEAAHQLLQGPTGMR